MGRNDQKRKNRELMGMNNSVDTGKGRGWGAVEEGIEEMNGDGKKQIRKKHTK